MALRGLFIHQLARKIDVLTEAMAELGKIAKASRPLLANCARIPPKTLQSAVSSERVSEEVQDKLATFCEVDLLHSSWLDPEEPELARREAGYAGTDTADNFRRHVRMSLGLRVDPRRLLREVHARMLDSHIASIAVSDAGQAVVVDQPIEVFLQVDLSPIYDPSGCGFRKVRIRFVPDTPGNLRIGDRLGLNEPVLLGKALLRARGTQSNPIWELAVDGGILDGECSTKDGCLCHLFEGQIGTEFNVELSAQLYDGTLLRSDGTAPEPRTRQVIIAKLLAKKMGNEADDHGWLMLGVQKLRIVKSES